MLNTESVRSNVSYKSFKTIYWCKISTRILSPPQRFQWALHGAYRIEPLCGRRAGGDGESKPLRRRETRITETLIVKCNVVICCYRYNLVLKCFTNNLLTKGLFIWAEVIPVSEKTFRPVRGGAKTILFGGCKTTFCRQKGVASALLGRCQNEPYSFLSDVQRWNPSSKIFMFKIGEIEP
jgi:hypothetical protein